MMQNFNEERCQILRAEINEALKVITEKYGIDIQLNKMTYSQFEIKANLALKIKDCDGTDIAAKSFFERNAWYYNLEPAMFGKKFVHGNKIFEIAGLCERKCKRPVICMCSDGQQYRFYAQTVKLLIKKGEHDEN